MSGNSSHDEQGARVILDDVPDIQLEVAPALHLRHVFGIEDAIDLRPHARVCHPPVFPRVFQRDVASVQVVDEVPRHLGGVVARIGVSVDELRRLLATDFLQHGRA